MQPRDIELLVSVSRPTVHPTGNRAVVAVSHPSLRANKNVGQLWEITDAAGRHRITRGIADSQPAYSPDGSLLAFLRAPTKGKPQLHVLDARGGEPRQVTDARLGVSGFTWSPDGTRIAFVARVPEPGRYGTVDDLDADAEPPRRIDTYRFHANGLGYTNDRRARLFVVDVPDPGDEPAYDRAPDPADARADHKPAEEPGYGLPKARQLTDGDFDVRQPAFSADGSHVLVVTARHAGRDVDRDVDLVSEVISVPVAGGQPAILVNDDHGLSIAAAAVTSEGTVVFLGSTLGDSRRDFVASNTALYLVDTDGPRRLTDPATIDLDGTDAESLVIDDDHFLVQVLSRGTRQLAQVGRDGWLVYLTSGAIEVNGAGTAAGKTTGSNADVVTWASIAGPTTFGELALVGNQALTVLTDFGSALQATGLAAATECEITARDGYPVHGWVYQPPGRGPHPVLLIIHGGPYAQYGVHVYDEAQVYLDAGYAVVMCNPRGSAGYGAAHGRAIKERMGTVDLTDVLDFLDGVLQCHPTLDSGRLGIMGGSYGGYLTAWAVAHDHRFSAALVERGFLDPLTFVGTSDIGSYFGDEYAGVDAEQVVAQSPMAVVHQVRTPTLVLHSENDYRCPLEQGTRYYAALKRNGVEAELAIFPGEHHELSRSGQPRHRLERFELILDWWKRKLPA